MRGGLQAWDPVNQKLVWRADGGGGIGGGTVTTAGNLVFQVVNDGTFRAYSADKGDKLFEAKTGRTGMGAPITYEAGGKQYVAFMGGLGRVAAVVGPTNDTVEFPPMLFVFELDGKAALPTAVAAQAPNGRPEPDAHGLLPSAPSMMRHSVVPCSNLTR